MVVVVDKACKRARIRRAGRSCAGGAFAGQKLDPSEIGLLLVVVSYEVNALVFVYSFIHSFIVYNMNTICTLINYDEL